MGMDFLREFGIDKDEFLDAVDRMDFSSIPVTETKDFDKDLMAYVNVALEYEVESYPFD